MDCFGLLTVLKDESLAFPFQSFSEFVVLLELILRLQELV